MIKSLFILQIAVLGVVTGVAGCGQEVEALNRAARGESPFTVYEDAAEPERQTTVEAPVAEPQENETLAEEPAPTVEEHGDTLIVTSPDGNSRSVVTQSGGGEAETRVVQEGGATIVERHGDGGTVTIIQGSGAALDQSGRVSEARERMEEMRSRMLSRMLD